MEDGIDRNMFLYPINTIEVNKYLYICIPTESCVNDLIITFEKEKVIKFLKEKTHRVEIYKKNDENLYLPTYDCLFINK